MTPAPSTSPKRDQLLILCFDFHTVDDIVADKALESFGRHLWFLTVGLVSLAFFSNSVENSLKTTMAKN